MNRALCLEKEKFIQTADISGTRFQDFYYTQRPEVQDKIDRVAH